MSDLIAFLNARLDEVEAAAKAADPGPWEVGERGGQDSMVWIREKDSPGIDNVGITYRKPVFTAQVSNIRFRENARHIARHDPARVLRDVEADRKLIAAYEAARSDVPPVDDWYEVAHGIRIGLADGLESALKIRAERFSDHPDYQPEWAS